VIPIADQVTGNAPVLEIGHSLSLRRTGWAARKGRATPIVSVSSLTWNSLSVTGWECWKLQLGPVRGGEPR